MRQLLLFIASLYFLSCQSNNLFEKRATIPNMKWQRSAPVIGDIQINDTLAGYNVYICLRHTDAYAYNNIWVHIDMTGQHDTILSERREIILGSDALGWEGTGMNDIWDMRKKINHMPVKFKKTGNYHFSVSHEMRENPLQGIMSAGIRLEKLSGGESMLK